MTPEPYVHTFSIVALDPATKDLGIAVASRYLAAGSVVPWAKAGVGAIATQALMKVSFGPNGLRLLEQGKSAKETLETLLAGDNDTAIRQLAVVDAKGGVAVHTGGLRGMGRSCHRGSLHGPREHSRRAGSHSGDEKGL